MLLINSFFFQLLLLIACLSLFSFDILSNCIFKIALAFENHFSDISNNTTSSSTSTFPQKSSPSFGMQEIENTPHNWIDVWRGIHSSKGSNFTDIRSVNYFSDGQFLNATIWLDDFTPSPPTDKSVNYGMYIDSDFNNKTGIEGINYKVEVQWHPESKSWTRIVEEWSTNGKNKTLEIKSNYTGFYQKGGSFVNLYANLKDMIYPQKYRILFYAEEKKLKGISLIMDSPKWVNIPPPTFIISANPSIINVKAGEQKTIEIQVKSSQGFQPRVNFFTDTSQSPSFVKLGFAYDKLKISSIGEASTPLTIYTAGDAIRYPYTAIISANFSFPSQESINPSLTLRKIIIPTENVIAQSTITIIIQDPASAIDVINDFWSKAGGFINFVYLTGGAAASWIFVNYIKKRKKNGDG